ncbi:MAG TPA: 2'-deoxycytidine 5'-triphosphate deaminase [Xanthobacteraceae bacterium]|nr:2'-deoxycytidine 5'-triphosphate deaminase [Xanthobacteraceae bacterium]
MAVAAAKELPAAGILPGQAIAALYREGAIQGPAFEPGQVQPASLDLRLGRQAWRVRASFLPSTGTSIAERLENLSLHRFDLDAEGEVLEQGCVYLVELEERFRLPGDLVASTNPKSSTGRLDVFTRVIGDRVAAFDAVPAGYAGPLYLEISPRTFPILVRRGSKLAQIRFRRGEAKLDGKALAALQARERLVDAADANLAMGAVAVSVDLSGLGSAGLAGFRAKKHTGLIDVDRRGAYEVGDFWEPLPAHGTHGTRGLVLDPDAFYILASKEAVHVPPDYAAEMVPFDPLVGEFRVHYAGFFDPGFGHAAAGGSGARAVLEVRSREVPFILEHSQIVGRLVYERMTERPQTLYGEAPGSNYQAQSLKLSKHFKPYQP